MNGINLEITAFQLLFVVFVMCMWMGIYLMAKGIDMITEALKKR